MAFQEETHLRSARWALCSPRELVLEMDLNKLLQSVSSEAGRILPVTMIKNSEQCMSSDPSDDKTTQATNA